LYFLRTINASYNTGRHLIPSWDQIVLLSTPNLFFLYIYFYIYCIYSKSFLSIYIFLYILYLLQIFSFYIYISIYILYLLQIFSLYIILNCIYSKSFHIYFYCIYSKSFLYIYISIYLAEYDIKRIIRLLKCYLFKYVNITYLETTENDDYSYK
jgi:hypothetical protein